MLMAEKSQIEIFLMPLVVAAVGALATYLITQQQIKSTSALQEAQRKQTQENAKLEQQIKILEIFSKNIVSQQVLEKKIALNVLNALLDSELATKLATAVSDAESKQSTEKTVQQVADRVVEEAGARTNLLPRIYIHIRAEEDRPFTQVVAEKLKNANFVVPGIERLVASGPASSQLRYFREGDKAETTRIADILKSIGVDVSPQYIGGYENSDTIRPKHYELWFPQGQPRPTT